MADQPRCRSCRRVLWPRVGVHGTCLQKISSFLFDMTELRSTDLGRTCPGRTSENMRKTLVVTEEAVSRLRTWRTGQMVRFETPLSNKASLTVVLFQTS